MITREQTEKNVKDCGAIEYYQINGNTGFMVSDLKLESRQNGMYLFNVKTNEFALIQKYEQY